MKRRNFVKTLAGLAAVGAMPSVASAAGAGSSEAHGGLQGPGAANPRLASGGSFSVQIDGVELGFVQSVEGGNAVADIVTEAQGGKHLGSTAIEPLKITLNAPPSAELTKILGETATGAAARHSVAITGYDFNFKATSYREYLNATLSEVALDPLEAASKEAVKVALTFQAEQVRSSDKGGAAPKLTAKQKAATAFRFTVSGLDSSAVASVEMPVWKRASVRDNIGQARTATTSAGKIELSPVTLTIAASQAQPWLDWFDAFVIQRKDTAERTAKLELLSADQTTVLYTVSLAGVGIAALRSPKYEAGKEAIVKLEAVLYAERITYGS